MSAKTCKCGYRIWTSQRWNGLAWYTVYHDDGEDCEKRETCFDVVTHCPGCGTLLVNEDLTGK